MAAKKIIGCKLFIQFLKFGEKNQIYYLQNISTPFILLVRFTSRLNRLRKIGNLKDIKFLLFQLSVDKGCRMCYQRGNSNNIDLSQEKMEKLFLLVIEVYV